MTGQSESEVVGVDNLNANEESDPKKKSVHHFLCSFDGCEAVFNRLYRLKRHMRQHTGERPFVCVINGCDRSFTCHSYLKKHQSRPHGQQDCNNPSDKPEVKPRKQYICNQCDPSKSFKSKFQLKLHNYQHSGQKPFICDQCSKQFVTKSKLKSHLKTHEGYLCGREGCDFKTCKWSELRKHIAIKHKCFRCDDCLKTFANSNNLETHRETVHLKLNQKIVCTYDNCHKTYSRKSNLMTHIKVVHEKNLFNCSHEDCQMSFLYKKSLNKHLENHTNPKPKKQKLCPRKVSKASELTGVELSGQQTKQLMEMDLQFRKEGVKG